MKRFFIWFSVFTVLLGALSVFFSPFIANASTQYDDILKQANPPYVVSDSYGANTVEMDDTYELGQFLASIDNDNATGWCGVPSLNSRWAEALEHIRDGTRDYSVFSLVEFNFSASEYVPRGIYVNVQMADLRSSGTSWSDGFVSADYAPGSDVIGFQLMMRSPGTPVACASDVYSSVTLGSNGESDNINYFHLIETNIDIRYPEGYEGYRPEPTINSQMFTPKIMYTVDNASHLVGYYMGQRGAFIPTNAGGFVEPDLKYVLRDGNDEVLNTKTLGLLDLYEFDLPGIGDYSLEVTYQHPGPPYASFGSSVKLLPLVFNFEYDGVTIVGSDNDPSCIRDGSGVTCPTPDIYQDCSAVWGGGVGDWFSSIPAYSQCMFDNFTKWYKVTLIQLFVPSYDFFKSWRDDFHTFLNDKLGFVYQSLGIVGSMFGGIVDAGANTRCTITPSGTLFGAPVNFNMCKFEEMFPPAFTAIRAIMIALTVIAVSFAGYRKYMEVVSSR